MHVHYSKTLSSRIGRMRRVQSKNCRHSSKCPLAKNDTQALTGMAITADAVEGDYNSRSNTGGSSDSDRVRTDRSTSNADLERH